MPAKRIRCNFKECRDAAQRIVGDCGFCSGHFCGKHRLLEDHKCSGLEDVSSSPSPAPWLLGLADVLMDDETGLLADMASPRTVQEAVTRAQRRTARVREDPGRQGRLSTSNVTPTPGGASRPPRPTTRRRRENRPRRRGRASRRSAFSPRVPPPTDTALPIIPLSA
jgi:AN1-like zinc finger protein